MRDNSINPIDLQNTIDIHIHANQILYLIARMPTAIILILNNLVFHCKQFLSLYFCSKINKKAINSVL